MQITLERDGAHRNWSPLRIEQETCAVGGGDVARQLSTKRLGRGCRQSLQLCREVRHAEERIPCMSLNPLDGLRIAFLRVAVCLMGKEATRYGGRELDILA